MQGEALRAAFFMHRPAQKNMPLERRAGRAASRKRRFPAQFAQGRTKEYAAKAACAPRGEQEKKRSLPDCKNAGRK
ncbi:MAG: hypothetical protein NC400_07815 [Clostridium sp.]|nr:hypothetical protein [Clostridium sp.]